MPNWCTNRLDITNPPKELRERIDKLVNNENDDGGLLQFFFPMPKEIRLTRSGANWLPKDGSKKIPNENYPEEDLIQVRAWLEDEDGNAWYDPKVFEALVEKYGVSNWYDWALQWWGTKWDVTEIKVLHQDDTTIEIEFDTAWSPPIEAIASYLTGEDIPEDIQIELGYYELGMCFAGSKTWVGKEQTETKDLGMEPNISLEDLQQISGWHRDALDVYIVDRKILDNKE
jgi:hypothetical protein